MRRALAWGIDFGLMVLIAVGLGFITYKRIVSPFSGVSSEVTAGVRDMVGSGFALGDAAAETGSSVWREVSSLVIQGFLALIVIQFLYQFVALAWTGRTVGKALLDQRVVPAAPGTANTKPGKRQAAGRAAITTITDTGLFSVACCLLLSGQVVLSVLSWLLAVVAFWGNALPTLSRSRRSLADMVAGTSVSGAGRYRAVARSVTHGGQAAATRISQGARSVSESERVKQMWESQRAQQLRQAGSGAADRGRQAWEQLKKTAQQRQQPPSGYAPSAPPPAQPGPTPQNAAGYPPPAHPAAPPAQGYAAPPTNCQPEPDPDPGTPPGHEPPSQQSAH